MLLLCVCERVIFHDCKLVHVCTRTRILLGQAQVDGLAGARALLHTHLRCAKCNLVSFVAITIAHMPMLTYVCVPISSFLGVLCILLMPLPPLLLLFFSFSFPIPQFDCGFQQIKFMAMAKRTKIPYLNSLKCQTYHFFLCLFHRMLCVFSRCCLQCSFCFFVTKNSIK